MKKEKIKNMIIASLLTGLVCFGVFFIKKTDNLNDELIKTKLIMVEKNNTIRINELQKEKMEREVESLKEAEIKNQETISTLKDELDLARQEELELTQEIRTHEKRIVSRMSRGAVNLSFTVDSDITKLRIKDAETLEMGLQGKLKGLGYAFVNAGISYGIDPLFLASIAAQESGWGKYDHGNNNIFGINSGNKYFSSKENCIYEAAKLLSKYYVAEGRTTPRQIQPKYCPSPTNWHYDISAVANTIIRNIERN